MIAKLFDYSRLVVSYYLASVVFAAQRLSEAVCVTKFEVRRRTGQPLLSYTVRIRRLKLFGHVARADKSQDHSRALQACISPAPRNWRRCPGRPRHTWLRTVEEDLRQFNLGLASGLRRAQNRTAWWTLTGTVEEQQRHRLIDGLSIMCTKQMGFWGVLRVKMSKYCVLTPKRHCPA